MTSVFCIVGAGMSGIVSAKHCIEQGYKVIILEKNSDIGGVWLSKSYQGVKLQTTKYSYAFSDYPHFKSTNLYPNREELMNYFREYCNKYNILKFCKFNSEVKSAKFNKSNNKWIIKYNDGYSDNRISVDYFLVASGFYTSKFIPNIIKNDNINKKIIHSEEFSYLGKKNPEIFKDKNVVFIGNGPTGCDLSTIAIKNKAASVKILYRSERWLLRRYLWNSVSTDSFLSRFMMNLGNRSPRILFIIVIIINYYIFYLFGHGIFSGKIVPPFDAITRKNLVLNDEIVNMIDKNIIQYVKCANISIGENNIQYLKDDKINNIDYDLCVICTGYKSDIKFLGMNSIPYMYKRIINPDFPNCCFIGFAASFNWVQVSELQIQWYLDFITRKSITNIKMNKNISDEINNQSSKAYDYHDLSILAFKYCDSLAKDLNIKSKYSVFNPKYWFKSPEHDLWSINNS